ncbi:hypothetical protein D7234_00105 [Legionella pneumophila]|nr:hypothetical protein D7242_09945 [Legionella pneumophila]RYW30795.1 hypothetical protein D7234_00105 [Legionella pneumophila]
MNFQATQNQHISSHPGLYSNSVEEAGLYLDVKIKIISHGLRIMLKLLKSCFKNIGNYQNIPI